MHEPGERPRRAAGWYEDPWRVAPVRWWNGNEWTGHVFDNTITRDATSLPTDRRSLLGFVAAAIVGVAIWIPTMAMHPRYSFGADEDTGSGFFWPLMMFAALALGAVFARNWRLIGVGLVLPQLAIAPWTTPRGDNDGLWLMVVPYLVAFAVVLHALAGLSAFAVNRLRDRRRTVV